MASGKNLEMDSNTKELKTEEKKSGQVRVWVDGCFDMVHFGHANALRQAKEMGDYLIVGIHTDEEIKKVKGPTVSTLEERCKLVRAIKWVDEVIEGVPYGTTLEILNNYNMDFCVHGDDIMPKADGTDPYLFIRKEHRLRECKRTEGISTTGLVNRMLQNEIKNLSENEQEEQTRSQSSPYTGTSEYLLTSSMVGKFSNNSTPKPGDKIVYVDGAFDLFHVGHVDFLKKAAAEGDFVILGLHTDNDVKRYKSNDFPIMSLYERLMCSLACKYVSDVVIGAPYVITKELMDHFKIDLVCHGCTPSNQYKNNLDPYGVPKKMLKFKVLDSNNDITTETIVDRVLSQRSEFEDRNKKKEAKELMILNKFSAVRDRWNKESANMKFNTPSKHGL